MGVAFGGGFYTSCKLQKQNTIYIHGKTKTVVKYIKVPKTVIQYKQAYKAPIKITAKVNEDILKVTCSDGWKKSEKGFKVSTKGNWKMYVAAGVGGAVLGGALVYGIYRLAK